MGEFVEGGCGVEGGRGVEGGCGVVGGYIVLREDVVFHGTGVIIILFSSLVNPPKSLPEQVEL